MEWFGAHVRFEKQGPEGIRISGKEFYIGVGIENCWMAQTDRPGTRLLDVFLQMQHYEKWKEDLQLAKDLGTNAIRYSVPWYKIIPPRESMIGTGLQAPSIGWWRMALRPSST